jgi:hypothetical protein
MSIEVLARRPLYIRGGGQRIEQGATGWTGTTCRRQLTKVESKCLAAQRQSTIAARPLPSSCILAAEVAKPSHPALRRGDVIMSSVQW